MTAPSGIVRQARTLSVMPTYTCTAACTNCASLSSPKVRDRLPREVILSAIEQAAHLNFSNVVFTGGEATLRWADLLAGLRYAKSLGLATRLVTNAHWATSSKEALQRLRTLRDAGLDEINYSTGDEHVKFVPLERVIMAALAALELMQSVWVMVELRQERKVTRETVLKHPLLAHLSEDQLQSLTINESPWMPLDPQDIEKYPGGVAAAGLSLKSHLGCDNVLQTYTLQATGEVSACCGIGMRLIEELTVARTDDSNFLQNAVESAEGDFLKIWLRYKGPEQILAWAHEKDPSIHWEGLYAHHCQSCARIYRDPKVAAVIRMHYEEVIADVLQAAWCDELHAPATDAPAPISLA